MRHFCLQLEASYLQLSFFAYSCVVEFFAYNWSFLATIAAFLLTLTVEALLLIIGKCL